MKWRSYGRKYNETKSYEKEKKLNHTETHNLFYNYFCVLLIFFRKKRKKTYFGVFNSFGDNWTEEVLMKLSSNTDYYILGLDFFYI